MKKFYPVFFLFLCYFSAPGQDLITFTQSPRDLQLYPRDANNQAEVVFSGTVNKVGYTKIGAYVLRESVLTRLVSQTLNATISSQSFSLQIPIKAERAEYTFQVFVYSGTDSTLVVERNRIVCGDVFIIHGQSNALALSELAESTANFDDKYVRNVAGSSAADMSWYAAKSPYTSVGGIGLALQQLILDNQGIPTCILNGALGGATIDTLKGRDPANHANTNTLYGRLLYRAQWAGVAKQVKAIIWKQGEAEAGEAKTKGLVSGYADKFATLYKQFREDYNPSARIYVGQINMLNVPGDSAATLRDFQRRTKSIFQNVETIATVGTPGYDGIHYDSKGHRQIAFEQYRLIARDFYGSTDTLQINSPDIKKVFYNARKDSITLVFDDQMKMVWKDSAYYDGLTNTVKVRPQKDYFYLDGQAGLFTAGSAVGNRIMLSLSNPSAAKTIRYLPSYFGNQVDGPYNGPTLKNTRGMRAFSFDNVSIADAIPAVTTLAAKFVAKKQIQLTWNGPGTNTSLVIERADSLPNTFRRIAVVNSPAINYIDANLRDSVNTYYYRLRVYSPVSESSYSNIARSQQLVLAVEPLEITVQLYPNPLATDRLLNVTADQATFTQMTVYDLLGRAVKRWQGTAKNKLAIALDDLSAGVYVAEFMTVNGNVLRRKLIIR